MLPPRIHTFLILYILLSSIQSLIVTVCENSREEFLNTYGLVQE